MFRKKILIVDDDASFRDAMAHALECAGYAVRQASNGLEALQVLSFSSVPALVLLDMLMPILSGHEFLTIISNDNDLSRIPVFVISADASSESVQGICGYLRKPVDLNILRATVSRFVD